MIHSRPATPGAMREAISLSLASPAQPPAEIAAHTEAFMMHMRVLPPIRLRQWLVLSESQPVAACTLLVSPARTALLMLPPALASLGAAADDVVRAALRECAACECRFLQCLINPLDAPELGGFLDRHGFAHLARLLYLERALSGRDCGAASSVTSRTLRWTCYSPAAHDDFVRTITATYEVSLDCPGLSQFRTPRDAVNSHFHSGLFKPTRWLLASDDQGVAGCILFNEVPLRAAMEVVYMGVVPRARGRGIGHLLLMHGMWLARGDGYSTVCLAVDENNAPARRIYAKIGFVPVLTRDAWITARFAATKG